MNLVRNILFPLLMLAGLAVSAFVIVNSLQAASSAAYRPAPVQVASANPEGLAAQGRELFLAKGCIVCHKHDGMSAARASMMEFDFDDVPNLTKLKINEDYLRRWLHDPQAIKPSTTMPKLELSETEIDALVAFLTTPN